MVKLPNNRPRPQRASEPPSPVGHLAQSPPRPHIPVMTRESFRPGKSDALRLCLAVTGLVLVMLAPLAGLLPGPGGILVFALGAGLTLRNSPWAKRRYVQFKRRWPKPGDWADWGLRRASAKRRKARLRAVAD